jgi:membrane protease YdiL (CAAX protease family)
MLALFAFYYAARADLVGSRGPDGAWTAVTAPARSPALHFGAAALLLGLLPLAAARWGCGIPLCELGLGLGNRRAGLRWLAVGLPAAVAAGWIASGSPAMRAVYPLDPSVVATPLSFVPHALRNLLYFGAWEVLFRGVLLFGLRTAIGAGSANSTQTGLSVAAHFGRPMTETFAAIPAGFAFGAIALRTNSIWYVALIHWTVGTSMDWFIVAGA